MTEPDPPSLPAVRFENGKTIRLIEGIEYEIVSLDDLQAKAADAWPRWASPLSGANAPLSGHWTE